MRQSLVARLEAIEDRRFARGWRASAREIGLTPVETAEDAPVWKPGGSQEEVHLELVNPPNGGLGTMRCYHLAGSIQHLDLAGRMLELLHAVKPPRVEQAHG